MMTTPLLEEAFKRGGWKEVIKCNDQLGNTGNEVAAKGGSGLQSTPVYDQQEVNDGESGSKDLVAKEAGNNQPGNDAPSMTTGEVEVRIEPESSASSTKGTGSNITLTDVTAAKMTQTEGLADDYYNGRRLQEVEEETKKLRKDMKLETARREKAEQKLAEAMIKNEEFQAELTSLKKRKIRVLESGDSDAENESEADEPERRAKKSKKKIYRCEICDKVFTRSTTLTRHVESTHELKKFVCKDCNFSFARADYLNQHKCLKKHNQVGKE